MDIKNIEARTDKPANGIAALILNLLFTIVSIAVAIGGIVLLAKGISDVAGAVLLIAGIIMLVVSLILYGGLNVVEPNHALVLTLFGNYYRTITEPGFYFVNPFSSAANPVYEAYKQGLLSETVKNFKKGDETSNVNESAPRKTVTLKAMTLDNGIQKVNDVLGNPIVIGAVVVWRVKDPTKAVFNVENYKEFLSIQTDSTVRNIARLYPYDLIEDIDEDEIHTEKTLRGSSQEIAESMKTELEKRVGFAGLTIEEVRITHLAYSEEIAAAMLQKQQAAAVIAARQKIVDGAVSMVKMAIDKLNDDNIVMLDEERKAQMVSNLLVVLCSNKDTQPIVNSGSIY